MTPSLANLLVPDAVRESVIEAAKGFSEL
jgi:hypothetical protein